MLIARAESGIGETAGAQLEGTGPNNLKSRRKRAESGLPTLPVRATLVETGRGNLEVTMDAKSGDEIVVDAVHTGESSRKGEIPRSRRKATSCVTASAGTTGTNRSSSLDRQPTS